MKTPWWSRLGAALLILYEIGWVIPWYRAMMNLSVAPDLLPSVLALGGLLATSYLAAALMSQLRLLRNVQFGGLMGVLAVGLIALQAVLVTSERGLILALVRIEIGAVVTALAAAWMWYRGFTLFYHGIRPVTVWQRFRFGLFSFMLFIFYTVQWGAEPPGLTWFVAFLFVGLLAVIFTRIAYVWVVKGSQRSPFDRRWMATILGSLMLILLVAGFLGSLLSGQYRLVLDLLATLTEWATTALLVILSLPVLLISLLIWPLMQWLIDLLSSASSVPLLETSTGSAYPYPYAYPEAEPSALVVYFTTACFWGLFIALMVLVFLRVRAAMMDDGSAEPEQPEWLLGRGELASMLRRGLQESWQDLVGRLRPVQRWVAAQRIRQIYAQVLQLSAERGQVRQGWQTPLEFLPSLQAVFPEHQAQVTQITQAYNRIRYGEYPESPAEVEAIEAAFGSLKNK